METFFEVSAAFDNSSLNFDFEKTCIKLCSCEGAPVAGSDQRRDFIFKETWCNQITYTGENLLVTTLVDTARKMKAILDLQLKYKPTITTPPEPATRSITTQTEFK